MHSLLDERRGVVVRDAASYSRGPDANRRPLPASIKTDHGRFLPSKLLTTTCLSTLYRLCHW